MSSKETALSTSTEDSSARSARVDAWIWAVRLAPTRTAAAALCTGGKVKIGGAAVKPSRRVEVGEEISVRQPNRRLTVRVERVLSKRVGAPVAEASYTILDSELFGDLGGIAGAPAVLWAARDRGTGRPTKKDRRDAERIFGAPKSRHDS